MTPDHLSSDIYHLADPCDRVKKADLEAKDAELSRLRTALKNLFDSFDKDCLNQDLHNYKFDQIMSARYAAKEALAAQTESKKERPES